MALSHFTLPGDEEEGDVVVDDDDDEEIVVVVDVDDEDDDIIIIISSVIVITLKAYFWEFADLLFSAWGKDSLSPFSILYLKNPCNAVQRKTTVQFNASIMFEIQCIISLLMSQYSALHVLQ